MSLEIDRILSISRANVLKNSANPPLATLSEAINIDNNTQKIVFINIDIFFCLSPLFASFLMPEDNSYSLLFRIVIYNMRLAKADVIIKTAVIMKAYRTFVCLSFSTHLMFEI